MKITYEALSKYPKLKDLLQLNPTRIWNIKAQAWLTPMQGHSTDSICAGVWMLNDAVALVESLEYEEVAFKIEDIIYTQIPHIATLIVEVDNENSSRED